LNPAKWAPEKARQDKAREAAAADPANRLIKDAIKAMYLRDMRKLAGDLSDTDEAAAALLQHHIHILVGRLPFLQPTTAGSAFESKSEGGKSADGRVVRVEERLPADGVHGRHVARVGGAVGAHERRHHCGQQDDQHDGAEEHAREQQQMALRLEQTLREQLETTRQQLETTREQLQELERDLEEREELEIPPAQSIS
jgi:hypothetical protein